MQGQPSSGFACEVGNTSITSICVSPKCISNPFLCKQPKCPCKNSHVKHYRMIPQNFFSIVKEANTILQDCQRATEQLIDSVIEAWMKVKEEHQLASKGSLNQLHKQLLAGEPSLEYTGKVCSELLTANKLPSRNTIQQIQDSIAPQVIYSVNKAITLIQNLWKHQEIPAKFEKRPSVTVSDAAQFQKSFTAISNTSKSAFKIRRAMPKKKKTVISKDLFFDLPVLSRHHALASLKAENFVTLLQPQVHIPAGSSELMIRLVSSTGVLDQQLELEIESNYSIQEILEHLMQNQLLCVPPSEIVVWRNESIIPHQAEFNGVVDDPEQRQTLALEIRQENNK